MSQSETSGEVEQFDLPDTILSRRAIFNSQERVCAYELQVDKRMAAEADEQEESMTAELLLRLVDSSLQSYVDNLPAFIPINPSDIQAGLPIIKNAKNVVFEIPEGLLDDTEKRRFFESVKRDDINFAWMHPKPGSLDGELLNRVQYVKLDMSMQEPPQLHSLIKFYKSHGIKLIADQVSSPSMFMHCIDLGFDYFMGYFFCMPRILEHKQVPSNKISVLQLICELQNPHTTLERIRDIVEKDVSLSYRVLLYINSPIFQFPKRIDSINNAILIAGLNTIKTLSAIVAHEKFVNNPPELFKVALIRARMAETMGVQNDLNSDSLFLLGLFSTLDALTDLKMQDITAQLPLSDDIRYVLENYINDQSDPFCLLLKAVVSFESANWDAFDATGFDVHIMREHFWKAVNWVGAILRMLSEPHLAQVK